MQQTLKAIGFIICTLGLVPVALAVDAQLLVYRVSEPGLDPYISRMLITPEYVRLDEGGNPADGFTLFQRSSGTIFNVSSEEKTITVMKTAKPLPESPVELKLTEDVETDTEAPKVGGIQPVSVQLLANGNECRELTAVPGIMQSAVKGLQEFRMALALIQGARLDAWPEDSRTPCDLAELIYAPTRGLAHGIALQDRSSTMSQSLVDFAESHAAADDLFVLPEAYERMSMPGLE